MASEQFSLCWDNFHKNMSSGMNSLLESEDLVDVTLAVQGKCLKAHKMVLSVCSPYFKELFKSNPCQHPIVFMKDVSYEALSDLLQFMYQGEVQVSQENLTTFIKTAEALQIKGLTGDGNGSTDTDTVETPEKPMPQPRVEEYRPPVTVPRPKKQPPPSPIVTASPSVKRQRLSQSETQALPPVITKTEPVSSTPPTQLPAEPVHFKMEPYDQTHSLIDETGDDNFGDDTLDDTAVDDTEDYSMMEGNVAGEDEPQAGTSTDGAGEGQDKNSLPAMRQRGNHVPLENWHLVETFCNSTDAENVLRLEKHWQIKYVQSVQLGKYKYYRCAKVKPIGPQCASQVYLYEDYVDKLSYLCRLKTEHDHDTVHNYDIYPYIKAEIWYMFELNMTVSKLIKVLARMPGLELPNRKFLYFYLHTLRRRYKKSIRKKRKNMVM